MYAIAGRREGSSGAVIHGELVDVKLQPADIMEKVYYLARDSK
jgi:hypothetical protein